MSENVIPIPARLKNVSIGGHVAGAEDIDAGNNKTQQDVNAETAQELSQHSTQIADLQAMEQIVIDGGEAQIAQGSDFDNPTSAQRAKVTTVGAIIDGLNDGVYDVSKRNPSGGPNSDGKFTLEYILSNADTIIPTGWRHGGMTISFVDSSDNSYVQDRYMGTSTANADFTNVANWQGIDETPTPSSKNIPDSNGTFRMIQDATTEFIDKASLAASWMNNSGTDYATFELDTSGHNGTWHLLKKSIQSSAIRMSLASLDAGKVYNISFDLTCNSSAVLARLDGSASNTSGSAALVDYYSEKAVYLKNGHVEINLQKTSDWSYLYINYGGIETLTYPLDVIISNFALSELKDIKAKIVNIEDKLPTFVSIENQSFLDGQKEQARSNIGALDAAYVFTYKAIDLSPYPEGLVIKTNNKWGVDGSSKGIICPITPLAKYKITTINSSIFALLKTDSMVSGDSPDFSTAEGFTERVAIDGNSTTRITAPADSNYIYLYKNSKNTGATGTSLYEEADIWKRIEELDDNIDNINQSIGDVYNEIPSKRHIADSVGNILTPLSIPLDQSGYEVAQTRELLAVQKKAKQMTDIVWTPIDDIPYRSGGDEPGTTGTFPAGVAVTGLPYSSVKEIDKYIGFDVSIHTFMTAVNNPFSLIYTENIKGDASKSDWGKVYHGLNCATYYGTVCSVLTGYGTGQPVQWPTEEDKWCALRNFNMIKVYEQNAQGLRIGDIYWKPGHNRLIVGLKRDSDGKVTHVQITESTGSHVRQNSDITAASFNSKLASEGGAIYRNIELYKNKYIPSDFVAVGDETITPYVYNDDICTFAGDKASFRENDLIVLNYDLKSAGTAWTSIEVYKNDVLLDTYTIANIDQSELPEGQRGHALKLGTELTYGSYKARLTDGTNYSDYTYWEILQADVTFSKDENGVCHIAWDSANGNPLSFTICNQAGVVYAHNELSAEEIANSYLDIDLVKFNKQQYPNRQFVSGMYLKVHFEGEYGRVTNIPLSVDLT